MLFPAILYARTFQSPLPIRGETPPARTPCWRSYFNPLSPYGERPAPSVLWTSPLKNFNPLSPYGERQPGLPGQRLAAPISIPSPHTGRDPNSSKQPATATGISIPSPHTGRDAQPRPPFFGRHYFNPLSPYGERRTATERKGGRADISIPSPHTGRDKYNIYIKAMQNQFQSPLPIRGETTSSAATSRRTNIFQSPLPIRGETHTRFCRFLCFGISIPSPHTGRDKCG